MTDPWAERLSEYVDGELSAPERLALESHLESCAACRAAVTELRRVREWLGSDTSHPGDAPTQAEWLAIQGRILHRRRTGRIWIGAGLLAAAAVLAILVTGSPSPSPSVYARATADLETALHDQRSRLRPETVRALERSLALIDGAIVQAQQALAADPANDYVIRSIDRLREQRLATLRDAVALAQW